MQRILSILFGAGFTVAAAWAAGSLLLRRLRTELDPLETVLFSFLSGSACVSLGVFLLCLIHQAKAGVFLVGGLAVIGCAMRWPARAGKPLPRIPGRWIFLSTVTLAPFFFVYLINAVAPEVSPDGSGYHLGNVYRFFVSSGFQQDYHSIYSAFPQGMEMLFLVAFAFGRHSAAALVHLAFLVSLPLLLVFYGRRFQAIPASVFAAIVVFVAPVFGLTGSSAYNDAAVVTLTFAVFYSLQIWDEVNSVNYMILSGLFVGYCASIKYTGAIAGAFAVTFLLLRPHRARWAAFLAASAVPIAPWLVRNWIWLGNPVAPFFNRWFPNLLFTNSLEKAYLADVRHFEGLRHWWEIPLDVTLYGAHIPGFLGPIFLLAPLALLAARQRQGRLLLAASIVFSLPFCFNAATRFLMPGMPFLALAIGIAVQNSPGIIPLLAGAQALFCWPFVTPLYAADWSWRLREIPVRAALRLEPEDAFLRRRIPDYALKVAIDAYVPPSVRIFSFTTRPEAYLDRTIVVGYESAEGTQILEELLRAPDHAGAELKSRNIGFMLMNSTDQTSNYFKQNFRISGLSPIAESNGTTLYRVD